MSKMLSIIAWCVLVVSLCPDAKAMKRVSSEESSGGVAAQGSIAWYLKLKETLKKAALGGWCDMVAHMLSTNEIKKSYKFGSEPDVNQLLDQSRELRWIDHIFGQVVLDSTQSEGGPNWKILKLFCAQGASANVDVYGDSLPGKLIKEEKNHKLITFLVKNGALNVVTATGELTKADKSYLVPILLQAVEEQRESAVKLLLALGADPLHEDTTFGDLLVVANNKGNRNIIRMIEEARRKIVNLLVYYQEIGSITVTHGQ